MSTEEHRDLCEGLGRLTPGFLPPDVFHAIARLMVTTTFVAVPLLERGGRIQVLLNERPADDVHYPAMLDIPGTVIRASDESLDDVFRRLAAAELPGLSIERGPVFVDCVYARIRRGREVSLIHWIALGDDAPRGRLHDVRFLPERLIDTDRPRIAMAAAHFQARRAAAS